MRARKRVSLHMARLHLAQADGKALRTIGLLEIGEAGALELLAELHRLRAEELESMAWKLGERVEAEAEDSHEVPESSIRTLQEWAT